MPKRILWKRGMRLTHDILRASDDASAEMLQHVLMLSAAGRFGLLPTGQGADSRPFYISLNIQPNGIVDVEALRCLGVTRAGTLIDIDYDTRYTGIQETRATMPENTGSTEYILLVSTRKGEWREVDSNYEEPRYVFSLAPADTPIANDALPIARIVDDHGWRMDDADFVPPCLFVSAHYRYGELLQRFADLLANIDAKAQAAIHSGACESLRTFWPLIQQLRIAADKERDLLTPMMLLAQVQKCVSAFVCATDMADGIELAEAKMFRSYVMAPYNYKDVYQRIRIGLNLCYNIVHQVEIMAETAPRPEQQSARFTQQARRPSSEGLLAPLIPSELLHLECETSETTITFSYQPTAATIYFTTDGSDPTLDSAKAARGRTSFRIKFDNGYRKEKGREPDKSIILKLIAVTPSASSAVGTNNVMLHKSLKFRNAIPV